MEITRRTFVQAMGACAGAALWRPRQARAPLRVGFVRGGGVDSSLGARATMLARGVELGAAEADQTAALLGEARIELVDGATAEEVSRLQPLHAIVGGLDEETCARCAEVAEVRSVLYLNAACEGEALRADGCHTRVFHVAPSAAMLEAARMESSAEGEVVAWHGSLRAFGAAQLNARFRQRFGTAMDGVAWCGWMAIKVVAEAAWRARSTDPTTLAGYLRHGGVRFDGHKGEPLTFSRAGQQLVQPLYLVTTREGGESEGVALRLGKDGRESAMHVGAPCRTRR